MAMVVKEEEKERREGRGHYSSGGAARALGSSVQSNRRGWKQTEPFLVGSSPFPSPSSHYVLLFSWHFVLYTPQHNVWYYVLYRQYLHPIGVWNDCGSKICKAADSSEVMGGGDCGGGLNIPQRQMPTRTACSHHHPPSLLVCA